MSGWPSAGHSVLAVPVEPLEAWVRARTAHYDAAYVSADPAFAHAHLTLLGPWLPAPSAADLAAVGRLLAGVEPFEVELTEVAAFPDGVVHVRVAPEEPLQALTTRLVEQWPQCPPYAGQHPDSRPHVTLDRLSADVSLGWVAGQVRGLVPAALRVDRVDLQWWGAGACRVLESWKLGEG